MSQSSSEFLEGFLVEAGEHLQSIQQNLLRLEKAIAAGEGPSGLASMEEVDELFRSFHTLKGLSGMVGFDQAARVSHAMETALQAVRRRNLPLSAELIDRLIAGTRAFEAITRAIQQRDQPAVAVDVEVNALEQLLQAEPAAQPAPPPEDQTAQNLLPDLAAYPELWSALKEPDLRKIQAAAQAGQAFALLVFRPTPEKAERGENIDGLRRQVQAAGSLLKAVPVFSDGTVHFLLLAALPGAPDASQLAADEIISLAVRAPQAAKAPPAPGAPGAALPETAVRVPLSRLDELMHAAGDLILLRARLNRALTHLGGAPLPARRELQQLDQQFARSVRDLRRSVLRARMVPLAETFNRMPLVVRDLARASGKDVQLMIEGENTEVDKALVERLLDPLIHLVRNAITHGIEPPAERLALGKPAQGRLTLRGAPQGDHILISVSDDGRGIDLEQVRAKAEQLGWAAPGAALSNEQTLAWITRPGFSTQDQADLAAGRGVGLDVVLKTVRSFGGQLSLRSSAGQGATFTLTLPLTLVILDALLVQIGAEQYAVPQSMLSEIVEIDPAQIVAVESGELLPFRDGSLALRRLADLVDLPEASAPAERLARPLPGQLYALISAGDEHSALLVDRVLNLREVVAQPLNDPYVAQPGISGATELAEGRVILILDVPALLRQARQR